MYHKCNYVYKYYLYRMHNYCYCIDVNISICMYRWNIMVILLLALHHKPSLLYLTLAPPISWCLLVSVTLLTKLVVSNITICY